MQWAREVYRVLRDDGVFWLNCGDVFAGGGRGPGGAEKQKTNAGSATAAESYKGIQQGNLMLMPYRIALALQADGWIVRQDLVWAKPNPMPESVNGWRWNQIRPPEFPDIDPGEIELRRGSWRHTRAHEYVFMLTKQMQYWSDQEAVRETFQTESAENYPARAYSAGRGRQAGKAQHPSGPQRDASGGYPPGGSGRNPRSVLHIPTAPYRGSHYATFPPALIAPLILATCPRWCCPVCGQGWAPVVEAHGVFPGPRGGTKGSKQYGGNNAQARSGAIVVPGTLDNRVLGHRATCDHPHTQAEAVSGIVCDPFVGSGTTVMVAKQLLRRGVGFDISRPYLREQALLRIGGTVPLKVDGLPLFQ